MNISHRLRRLRKSDSIRNLTQETWLNEHDVLMPFFIVPGEKRIDPISSMPGIYRYSIDMIEQAIENYIQLGGQAVLLFGLPEEKDEEGTHAYRDQSVVTQAVKLIKSSFPQLYVMTDICLCSYTDHGHCGIIQNDRVDNDKTVEALMKMSLLHAQSGADMVAPSDMMDGRIGQIRSHLDQHGFQDVAIMSYTAKYQSAFYGPFRDAADSTPQFGDRKGYQMNPANKQEAVREAELDIVEGADILMVKPALAYLDIISEFRSRFAVPVSAYHVSGEYSMIKAAADKNWIDEKSVVLETLTSIKRSGANLIVTYFAQDVLRWLKEK